MVYISVFFNYLEEFALISIRAFLLMKPFLIPGGEVR